MAKLLATDISTLYTRLNTVRAKHSLAPLTRSVSGTVMATHMDTLRTDFANTSSSSSYIPTSTYASEFSTVSVGALIKQVVLTNATGIVNDMDNVCIHDSSQRSSNYGDYSDRSRDSDCSSNRTSYDSSYKSSNDSDLSSYDTRDGTRKTSVESSFKQHNASW